MWGMRDRRMARQTWGALYAGLGPLRESHAPRGTSRGCPSSPPLPARIGAREADRRLAGVLVRHSTEALAAPPCHQRLELLGARTTKP
jgi:hypothetical protein